MGDERSVFWGRLTNALDEEVVWQTTIRATVDNTEPGTNWFSVDVERFASGPYDKRFSPAAPRLVRELLDQSEKIKDYPFLGPNFLQTTPYKLHSSERGKKLASSIKRQNRSVPYIVFTEPNRKYDDQEEREEQEKRALACARRLAGIATVILVNGDADSAFFEHMPAGLEVWGGAARIYLPNLDSPIGHRYIKIGTLRKSVAVAAHIFALDLMTYAPARTLPQSLSDIEPSQLTKVADDTTDQLLQMQDEELRQYKGKIKRLEGQVATLEEKLEHAETAEFQATNEWEHWEEVADGRRDWAIEKEETLRKLVVANKITYEDIAEIERANEFSHAIPETVEAVVEWAKTKCAHVRIPESAIRIKGMQSTPEDLYNAFQALNQYATAPEDSNGFLSWCENYGEGIWMPNRVAMTETNQTKGDNRLMQLRTLPVDRRISETGFIEMVQHLHLATGNTDGVGRLYFHDDVWGKTGNIHIGYVGPHLTNALSRRRT